MTTHISSENRPIILGLLSCLMLAMPAVASADDDSDSDNRPSACDRTAGRMYQACAFDVRDDLNETLANCLNLASPDDRRQCRRDARATRAEEKVTCRDVRDARSDACELLGEGRYDLDPLLDPTIDYIDPDDVPGTYAPNPYVSVAAGHTYVLRAGEEGEEIVVVHVTGDSREILGVLCRIVVDVVVEVAEEDGEVEYEAVEATDDLFAQDTNGNVKYCGEVARNFEDGVLRDLDGSFEAGREFAKAGRLIDAFPIAGDVHRTEFLLGEAEDIIQYIDLATAPTVEEGGDNPAFPCAPGQCLKTLDFAPLEPDATEYKYYLPGTGFVLAVALEDGEVTGEREELTCVGDSLDILQEPECGIADLDGLLEALCGLAPDTFCEP